MRLSGLTTCWCPWYRAADGNKLVGARAWLCKRRKTAQLLAATQKWISSKLKDVAERMVSRKPTLRAVCQCYAASGDVSEGTCRHTLSSLVALAGR